jgi:magnesium transporter
VQAKVILYDDAGCTEQAISSIAELRALRTPGKTLWLNVDDVSDGVLLNALAGEFGWHPLAVEDVASLHERPKTEEFGEYTYVVVYMPRRGEGSPLEQLSILFGDNYVATIQGGAIGDCLDPVRKRLRDGRGKLRTKGAEYLAYALIDVVVDHYFPLLESMNDRLEKLEQEVLSEGATRVITEVPAIRSDLHLLWRTLAATREAITELISEERALVSDDIRFYLRDCVDHCAQLLDAVEACRELSSNLLELNQALVNNRTGETMRVLTLIATIFMPLSFIAGLYGMNFDRSASPWNMPELGWYAGYPMALGLMGCTVLGFLVFFWRAGWLSSTRPGNGLAKPTDAPTETKPDAPRASSK